MNKLIKANTEKLNRLVNVSRSRRAVEMDFFTEASNKYRDFLNYPLATNPNEDESLTEVAKKAFIEEAQAPMYGVVARQTRLKLDIKNMSQEEIKADKKYIDNYFSRLDKMVKLVGYAVVSVEPMAPENLPDFISNYENININGTNEKVKDRNMFMAAAWAKLFNYFNDVEVTTDFYFDETSSGEIAIIRQDIDFLISGKTFKRYLHKKPYIVDNFLNNKNIVTKENGKSYYRISGEIDSFQVDTGELLDLYISNVPNGLKVGDVFENAGITRNATLQPQYFLGGSVLSQDPSDVAQDTSIKIPMYSVQDNKVSRYFVKPINTNAINKTPAYTSQINSHIAGVFAVASGNISVLSGYSNKRLGLDLPLGINEYVTDDLEKLYKDLSPEGKVNFVGNRYAFNKISPYSSQKISLVDAQKAWLMQAMLDHALDVKLPQPSPAGQPTMVKETLESFTQRGRDLIKALNDNEMPLPEFYKDMLGINEWQEGMPIYYQQLPEEVSDIPAELDDETKALVEQYM